MDEERRFILKAIFWGLNIPPVVGSYFLLGRDTWEAIMLVYLAVVSIWALVDTNLTGAAAARARKAAEPGD